MKKLTVFCTLAILCALLFSGFDSSVTEEPVDLTFGGLVSEETILSAGHQRITEKYADVLNTVEYENNDGTRTAYLFTSPVKYVDEDGAVQRIDNDLTPALLSNGWKTTANWFDLSVSNDFTKGVTLSCYDNALTVAPVLSNGQATLARERDALLTKESLAFSNDTDAVTYTPTNTGYSTNVSLQGGLPFSLDVTGDIASVAVDGNRATVTMTDGYTAAYALAAYDVNGAFADTAGVTVSAVATGRDSYRLTFSSSAAEQNVQTTDLVIETTVTNASTANTNTRSTTSDSEVIPLGGYQDAAVYSNHPNNNYGSESRSYVGVHETRGTGRAYYHFDLDVVSDIPYDRILSANFFLRELSAQTTSFQAVAYIIQDEWSETGITWSNRPNCFDEKLCTVNADGSVAPPGGSRFQCDFYITSAVMAWLQGLPNRGIMVKSRVESAGNCRTFANYEYVYMSYFTVTYSTGTWSMNNIGIVDDAEYYIKNKHSMLYLTVSGSSNGSAVTQNSWTGADTQKWKVTPQDSGYYKLSPANAPQKVLDNRDSSSAGNVPMRIAGSSPSTSQEFNFIRNWDGSYQIVSRISNDARGLCAKDNNTNENGSIVQRSHTTNWVKSDDWTLEPVAKGIADVYSFTGVDYDGLDTTEHEEYMRDYLNAMTYTAEPHIDSSSENAYNRLSTDSVWIFTGHGGDSCAWFKNNDYISASEYYEDGNWFCVTNKFHNELAKLELAVFACCQTGLDDTVNNSSMVGVMYEKGTRFVIAWTDIQYIPHNDDWVIQFLEYCAEGQTVYEAMNNADNYLYENYAESVNFGNAVQRHILGDNSLCLYHPSSS